MIQAIGSTVIVKILYEKNKGQVIIPETAIKFKQYDGEVYGEVESVGPRYPYNLKAGDKLIFQRHEGSRIEFEGVKYLKLKEKWVHGVIVKGPE